MVDFGVTKVQKARNVYLGHRVKGDVAAGVKKGQQKKTRSSQPIDRIEQLKQNVTTPAMRVKSLSKRVRRLAKFNIEDDGDDDVVTLNGNVTAAAASRRDIANALNDDFEDSGLIMSDDEQHDRQLNPLITGELLFGEGGNDSNKSKLSRKDRLADIISQSKLKKAITTKESYQQAALLEETNLSLKSVLDELEFRPTRANAEKYKQALLEEAEQEELQDHRSAVERARDDDFDNLLKSLAQQPKGKAAERKKSGMELRAEAKKQKEKLLAKHARDMARADALGESESENSSQSDSSDASSDENEQAEAETDLLEEDDGEADEYYTSDEE